MCVACMYDSGGVCVYVCVACVYGVGGVCDCMWWAVMQHAAVTEMLTTGSYIHIYKIHPVTAILV